MFICTVDHDQNDRFSCCCCRYATHTHNVYYFLVFYVHKPKTQFVWKWAGLGIEIRTEILWEKSFLQWYDVLATVGGPNCWMVAFSANAVHRLHPVEDRLLWARHPLHVGGDTLQCHVQRRHAGAIAKPMHQRFQLYKVGSNGLKISLWPVYLSDLKSILIKSQAKCRITIHLGFQILNKSS